MKDGSKARKQKQTTDTEKSNYREATLREMARRRAGRAKARKTNSPGPHIVRAWFDTVINPLLDALRTEQEFTTRKNWTWRWRSQKFELLLPVEAIVGGALKDNLVQLMNIEKAVESPILQHDRYLLELAESCKQLQDVVYSSPNLQKTFKKATSKTSLQKLNVTIHDIFGGYPLDDQLGIITQYVINRTPPLPDYYVAHQLWNEWRETFIQILDDSDIKSLIHNMDTVGIKLLQAITRLINTLEKTRDRLSLVHDVPYRLPPEKNISESPWSI